MARGAQKECFCWLRGNAVTHIATLPAPGRGDGPQCRGSSAGACSTVGSFIQCARPACASLVLCSVPHGCCAVPHTLTGAELCPALMPFSSPFLAAAVLCQPVPQVLSCVPHRCCAVPARPSQILCCALSQPLPRRCCAVSRPAAPGAAAPVPPLSAVPPSPQGPSVRTRGSAPPFPPPAGRGRARPAPAAGFPRGS